MDYAEKHREALDKLRAKNAIEVQFGSIVPGEYDPLTDTSSPDSERSVRGLAIETPGDPELYEALELIRERPLTIFFVPFIFGEEPQLDDVIYWAGHSHVVKALLPIRPDGRLIAMRTVVV